MKGRKGLALGLGVAALMLVVVACGNAEAPPSANPISPTAQAAASGGPAATPTQVYDYVSLIDDLETAGAHVDELTSFSVGARSVAVNSGTIQVYEFSDDGAATTEAGYVSPDGYNITVPLGGNRSKSVHSDWLAPPHYYKKGRLIVLYVGEDPSLVQELQSILGPEFAGPTAGNAPTPTEAGPASESPLMRDIREAAADGADPSSLAAPALANDEEVEPRSRDARLHPSDEGAALENELSHAALQDPVGELQAELAAKERDTFAGLWIEWTPQFRVVVLFTRDGEETIRPYIENAPFADVVEVRTVRATLGELQNADAAANRAVGDLGIAFNSGTNLKENRVELYVLDPEALDAALLEASMHLPEYVEVVRVDTLATPAAEDGSL